MSWEFVDIVSSEKDIAGKLRVRILCKNKRKNETFFLKFNESADRNFIKSKIDEFIELKNIPDLEAEVCPRCNQEIR